MSCNGSRNWPPSAASCRTSAVNFSPSRDTFRRVLGAAGRAGLTVVVLCAGAAALGALVGVHRMLMSPPGQGAPQRQVSSAASPPPGGGESDRDLPWPHFPRNTDASVYEMTLNGVRIISETWGTGAPAQDVLAYYREQMSARDWADVTEETYDLKPELHDLGSDGEGLQDPLYLENYRRIMESSLVLSRGTWTLQIGIQPAGTVPGQNEVKLLAAETPSIRGFSIDLAAAFVKGGEPGEEAGRPVDIVDQRGGERYHTSIATVDEAPARAFQEALAGLGTKGWQRVVLLNGLQAKSGYFTWLVNGRDYASLSVKALADGGGSSVSLTEVTSEAGKGRKAGR